MKNVAVFGCTLQPVAPATGVITITPNQQSQKVFINNKGVYFDRINFTVSGSNGGGSIEDDNGTGSGYIVATGRNLQEVPSGKLSVLEGDTATLFVEGTAGGEEVPPAKITVKVTNAGQTDVSLT
jgi:hypothetical protein